MAFELRLGTAAVIGHMLVLIKCTHYVWEGSWRVEGAVSLLGVASDERFMVYLTVCKRARKRSGEVRRGVWRSTADSVSACGCASERASE